MKRMLLAMSLMLSLTGCRLMPHTTGSSSSICEKAQGTHLMSLGLDPHTYTYKATQADPLAFCEKKPAIIEMVKNISGHKMYLAHDSGPQFILEHNVSVDSFRGQRIEGNWFSAWDGEVKKAPQSLALEITWRRQ